PLPPAASMNSEASPSKPARCSANASSVSPASNSPHGLRPPASPIVAASLPTSLAVRPPGPCWNSPGRRNSASMAVVSYASWTAADVAGGGVRRGRAIHGGSMSGHRIFKMKFSSVYPLYVQKAQRKGRTQAEVDQVIRWLTGYSQDALQRQIADELDFETFFAQAPAMNPASERVTGVVCGVRVEEVADP